MAKASCRIHFHFTMAKWVLLAGKVRDVKNVQVDSHWTSSDWRDIANMEATLWSPRQAGTRKWDTGFPVLLPKSRGFIT
jgi:hypothetical protein